MNGFKARAKKSNSPWKLLERLMKIAFFGSSLVSAYWNGAATYYRGLIRAAPRSGAQNHFLRTRRLFAAATPRYDAALLG